jgi:hypothetical protein
MQYWLKNAIFAQKVGIFFNPFFFIDLAAWNPGNIDPLAHHPTGAMPLQKLPNAPYTAVAVSMNLDQLHFIPESVLSY